ncbi:hypothetical protein OIU79_029365 [Salix purpurea]|uniref:Uncharacterized protein n=2 Tax=Salix TaxID=40685 RepID=A0A9Q0VGF8_SALPP|nr:hypothetical protein OIU84_001334 [Salix udensis]KAJ6748234.1 hypothetical protein OIU79_029365 [Salix purpurea]
MFIGYTKTNSNHGRRSLNAKMKLLDDDKKKTNRALLRGAITATTAEETPLFERLVVLEKFSNPSGLNTPSPLTSWKLQQSSAIFIKRSGGTLRIF